MTTRYTIEERKGCTLVFGSVPVEMFLSLTQKHGKNAVMDTRAARMAGASMAFGAPEALAALCREMEASARYGINASPLYAGLSDGAREWLATGEQGISSMAMFAHATGIRPADMRPDDAARHPLDLDDLRRCRLLMEQVPEVRERLAHMADLSPAWSRLVDAWGALCSTMDEEAPDWRSGTWRAPKAASMMEALRLWG